MNIIAVCNQKGGCGKTITAVNLAGALAGLDQKVLFVDLDPQAHATAALGITTKDPKRSIYTVFDSFLKNESAHIPSIMRQRYDNLWVVASHISLSTMEQKLAGIKDAVLVFYNALKQGVLAEFDYIIIDTPPNLGFLTLNAIHAAKRILVPLDTSMFSLNGVSQIDEILELSNSMGFKRPDVNFLITIYDKRSNFAKNFLQNANERFSKNLMHTIIRSNIKLREAAQSGKIIFEYDKKSNGATDYHALAEELIPKSKEKAVDKKESSSEAGSTQTLFKIHAPGAQSVYLVGSFNNWVADNNSLMKKLDNWNWIKIIPLPEGTYHYKFAIDGKWVEDPANSLTETNGLGGKNSLISVMV
ncbi:MAG: AAA family ATPase [Candidatus Omnitrophota bacterium]